MGIIIVSGLNGVFFDICQVLFEKVDVMGVKVYKVIEVCEENNWYVIVEIYK